MKKIDVYFKNDARKWLEESYVKSVAIERKELALEIAEKLAPASVLDVGCGDGRFLGALKNVKRKVGVDYSKNMIESANDDTTSFETADLNNPSDLQIFGRIGCFELISMLGVIHYLDKPEDVLRSLRNAAAPGSIIMISFRNRLFNISPESAYSTSALTERDFRPLVEEGFFWTKLSLAERPLESAISEAPAAVALSGSIASEKRFLGLTDPGWNPNGFENWRQFTPLGACALLKTCGFTSEQIHPMHLQVVPNGGMQREPLTLLPYCSSFLLLARL